MKGILIVKDCKEAFLPLTQNGSHLMLQFFNKPLIDFQLQLFHHQGITEVCVISEQNDDALRTYLETDNKAQYLVLPNQGISLAELARPHKHCLLMQQFTLTNFVLDDFIPKKSKVTAVFSRTDALLQKGIFFFCNKNYHFQLSKGKDLLSALSEQKIPVEILDKAEYFHTVTNLTEYVATLKECLDNQDSLPGCHHSGGVIHEENTFIEVGAKIKPPVYLGNHVTIRKNAEILPYSVICNHTVVGENAKISHSLLLPHCRVESSASVYGSVLDFGVTVAEDTVISEGSVCGKNLTLSLCNTIPNASAESDKKAVAFLSEGIPLPTQNTTTFLQKLGQICGTLFGKGILGLFWDGSVKAQFLSHSLRSGLQASGASLYEFPPCTLSMCRSACPFYRLKAGFYLQEGENEAILTILDQDGHILSPKLEEQIQIAMMQPSLPDTATPLVKIVRAKPYQLSYYPEITRKLGFDSAECKLWVNTPSQMVWEYLRRIANCHKITLQNTPVPDVIGLDCNCAATKFTLYDENHTPLTPRQKEAITAALAIEEKEDMFVITQKTSQALCRYLTEHLVTPVKADPHPYDAETMMSNIPLQAYLTRDPIFFTVKVLLYLKKHQLTLSEWVASLPKSFLIEKTVTAGDHLAEAIQNLLKIAQKEECICENQYQISSRKGNTTVTVEGDSFKIVSESTREEYAKELTDFCIKQCFPCK